MFDKERILSARADPGAHEPDDRADPVRTMVRDADGRDARRGTWVTSRSRSTSSAWSSSGARRRRTPSSSPGTTGSCSATTPCPRPIRRSIRVPRSSKDTLDAVHQRVLAETRAMPDAALEETCLFLEGSSTTIRSSTGRVALEWTPPRDVHLGTIGLCDASSATPIEYFQESRAGGKFV